MTVKGMHFCHRLCPLLDLCKCALPYIFCSLHMYHDGLNRLSGPSAALSRSSCATRRMAVRSARYCGRRRTLGFT